MLAAVFAVSECCCKTQDVFENVDIIIIIEDWCVLVHTVLNVCGLHHHGVCTVNTVHPSGGILTLAFTYNWSE